MILTIVRFFARRPSWERIETSFRYELSFNGSSVARFGFDDLGIEPLSVELGPDRQVYVSPCRVVNGCEQHEARGIVLHWTTEESFEERLTKLEKRARSLDLTGTLGQCLVGGPCSERPFGPYWHVRDPHANVPPWELTGHGVVT